MSVSFDHDATLRRSIATVPAGTPWRRFEQAVLKDVQGRPEVADWDLIIDDQGPMDDVDAEGMVRIGELFRSLVRSPERRTYTVVVTQDRFFGDWARVIDLHYGNRKHYGAPSLAAAIDLMNRLTATRDA